MTRVGALGFCIQDGQLSGARVHGAIFSGTVHRGWKTPTCADASTCALTEALPPLMLTEPERTTFANLVAAVPAGDCSTVNPVCDPCLVTRFDIGGTTLFDEACRRETCPGYFTAIRALRDFMDGLGARALGAGATGR